MYVNSQGGFTEMKQKELTLSEIQQGSFQILLKLREIFQANHWTYYLAYGTLLGAIRHNGFIPWDDDIDIQMPRKDYEEFVKYCIENREKLLPFELMHYKANPKYIYSLARFSDSRYSLHYKNVKDYGLGLFVDIYPLDNAYPQDEAWRNEARSMIYTVTRWGNGSDNPIRNLSKKILRPFFYHKQGVRNQTGLIQKHDLLAQKHNGDPLEYLDCVLWEELDRKPYRAEWFRKGVLHEFNGQLFNIPENYDAILKQSYGDYMKLPPKEEQIAHHFYSAFPKEDK